MRNILSRLSRFAGIAAAIAVLMLGVVPTLADKVVTKDGKTYEGEIIRQADSFVTIRVKEGDKEIDKTFFMSQVDKIVKDDDAAGENDAPTSDAPAEPDGSDDATAPAKPDPQPKAKKPGNGATKIAFVTLGDNRGGKDMVGPYMNDGALRESVKILSELPEDEKPDILVLWIDSGGGALSELEKLTRTIHTQVKPKFRTVAWIRSAISAAAMTAWACEEIYMMSNAPIGACTGFYGASGVAVQGKELARVLDDMEDVSRWGKHEPLVMRAMQICEPQFPRNELTADIDENGNVTWYDGPQGQYLVCPRDRILTLNALDATKFKVARGIADTKDELAKLMGCAEWVEVGTEADRYQERFRDGYKLAETMMQELLAKIDIQLQFAGGAQSEQERNGYIGRALGYLREMRGRVRQSPSLAEYERYTDRWFTDMEERIKEMRNR